MNPRSFTARCMLRLLACLLPTSVACIASADTGSRRDDALACASPFELQLVRDMSFGRIVVARGDAGQVEIDGDGSFRQLGGAYVALPASPGELNFCGPAGAAFEIRMHPGSAEESTTIRLAPGSVSLVAGGAELRRLDASVWEGIIGIGGRVSLRFGGRVDISAGVPSRRFVTRLSVSLRSR